MLWLFTFPTVGGGRQIRSRAPGLQSTLQSEAKEHKGAHTRQRLPAGMLQCATWPAATATACHHDSSLFAPSRVTQPERVDGRMPRIKRQARSPTDEWAQLRLFVRSPEQELYEALRPIVLLGRTSAQRAQETGHAERTLRRKADAFDTFGMRSLFATLPGFKPDMSAATADDDRRVLPPRMRQLIVDLHAEHPPLNLRELATICYTRFGRRPSHHTVKRILAEGHPPSRSGRRYPFYDQMPDPEERRLAVVHLHAEGWNASSIATYLHTTRARVHQILRRWADEGVRGLANQSRTPKAPARKLALRTLAAIRRLQANPELGEYRIQAALEQLGIHLSARTCGRVLALNRRLYDLPGPGSTREKPREPKEMPFRAERRHQYWTTDVRYLDHPTPGRFYVLSILENFSRALLASVLSPRQDLTAYLDGVTCGHCATRCAGGARQR